MSMMVHQQRRKGRRRRRGGGDTIGRMKNLPTIIASVITIASMPSVVTSAVSPSIVINANARFVVAAEEPPASNNWSPNINGGGGSTTVGVGLQLAMDEFTLALDDTRRILEDAVQDVGDIDEETTANNNLSPDEPKNNNNDNSRHPPSDWWERLYQGGPLYDQWTGKLIEETKDGYIDGLIGEDDAYVMAPRPANRRSHSAAIYRMNSATGSKEGDGKEEGGSDKGDNDEGGDKHEWMVISGGFTDDDWSTFPVWAYDLSGSRSIREMEEEVRDLPDSDNLDETAIDGVQSGNNVPWVDLTRLSSGGEEEGSASLAADSSSSEVWHYNAPQGRVGHLSSVYNDCLYIFGGLTYRMGTFHVDYGDDEDGGSENTPGTSPNSLAIWKACGLDRLLANDARRKAEDGMMGEMMGSSSTMGREDGFVGLKWERISAKVDTRPPNMPRPPNRPAHPKHDDGGNDAQNSNGPDDDDEDEGDERALGWDDLPPTRPRVESVKPSVTLPRGEAQGGHYTARGGKDKSSNDHDDNPSRDCFILYGGMHHRHSSLTDTTFQGTTILGDVWAFEYETETLKLLSPYPPLSWQRDERNGSYPKSRTAHAGTVVGNELIIHGGMRFGDEEEVEDRSSSSFSSPSNTYATYRTTSSSWQALSDVWVFDLQTLKWKERIMYPQLARSYHSMVGWGNGTVAAFGGFQQDNNIPRETIAFVFKDLLVSRPNETYWQKLQPPHDSDASGESIASYWRSSSQYTTARPGISNRLEHTAVLDEYGSMYIWGGRFQTVRQIVGLWRLDVFTEDANLQYDNAPPDGIDAYEAELEALHMFIATMMFMSLTISSLFSMMRRQAAEAAEDGGGGGGGRSLMGRRGLSRQVIDSLPVKRYHAPHTEVTEDGDVVEDVSLSRENSRDESGLEENLDCCPICLVPYEDGVSEVRTLPCGHCFDRECIDPWFADHTTCPSCRQNIDNTPLHSTEEPASIITISEQWEFDPRFQFLSAFDTRRRHSHWTGLGESTLTINDDDGATDASSAPSSNDDSNNDENDDHAGHGSDSVRPRFLRIRRFFSRRGHHGVAVPGEEEVAENIESIELV